VPRRKAQESDVKRSLLFPITSALSKPKSTTSPKLRRLVLDVFSWQDVHRKIQTVLSMFKYLLNGCVPLGFEKTELVVSSSTKTVLAASEKSTSLEMNKEIGSGSHYICPARK